MLRHSPVPNPEHAVFVEKCKNLPHFEFREPGHVEAEIWNQGGQKGFTVTTSRLKSDVRHALLAAVTPKPGGYSPSCPELLRARFLYAVTFDEPIADKWTHDCAPIEQPKVKFALDAHPSEAASASACITLTLVKKSDSGPLPLSSKHNKQLFQLVCEVLIRGVWTPWAVSEPTRIISKMSQKDTPPAGQPSKKRPRKATLPAYDDDILGSPQHAVIVPPSRFDYPGTPSPPRQPNVTHVYSYRAPPPCILPFPTRPILLPACGSPSSDTMPAKAVPTVAGPAPDRDLAQVAEGLLDLLGAM